MKFPPGPRSALVSYYFFRRDPPDFLRRMARKHGDIVHWRVGSRHDFLLNHPDLIKEIMLAREGMARSSPRPLRQLLGAGLLTTDGDHHADSRRLVSPLFHRQHAGAWTNAIVEYSQRLGERWREGETVDVARDMLSVALSVVVKLLLSVDLETQAPELKRVIANACVLGNENTFPSLTQLLLGAQRRTQRLQQAIVELDAILYERIRERGRANGSTPDMLSSLLWQRDGEPGDRPLADRQIRDEMVTLMVAGHETIGNALAWTWYLIALHPAVEGRFHDELAAVLGGRPPGEDDVRRLTYTGMILTESMRLYPPVWVFTRRPLRDWKLDGYVIPAGSYVQMSPYVTQRDPRYFSDPERFDPDRWAGTDVTGRNPYTYFPFAGGMHRCIGESFAWAEGVLVLATLGQRWRLRRPDARPVRPEALITLRPRGGMPMTLEARR